MTVTRQIVASIFIVVLTACGFTAQAEVIRYYARNTMRGETQLVGVTVQRGGREVTFDASKLHRVTVTQFRSNETMNLVTAGEQPADDQRHKLLGDGLLNTGVINPGGSAQPLTSDPVLEGTAATPGLAITFDRPVANLPGDDVVLFEFHRSLHSPPEGDAFHVSPWSFRPGLQSLTVSAFDFPVDDPRAVPTGSLALWRYASPPPSPGEFATAPIASAGTASDFQVLAVGIDLSALGYGEGESVSGLFLQDAPGTELLIDPVEIVGLPAPDAENLLAEIPRDVITRPQPGDLLRQMLDGPLAHVEEMVFAVRVAGWDHWYANFGYYAATVPEYPPQQGMPDERIPPLFGEGGQLCRLNLRTGELQVLLDDPQGGVRDPQVHYGGKKILFSYRPGGQAYYHLYEIDSDGGNLRQLTHEPFDDIEPTYLPDGGIMFCSSRGKRFVNCYRTPVAVLYRCDADGQHVRMISSNIEHDNTPWPLLDGRVLYMRWEYVDRSQFCFHHLWASNPDGTGQMVLYGNQFPDTAMLDAKPIPGSARIVASFSPGHGMPEHMGHITIVDPTTGPDQRSAARRISRDGRLFRDPYPVSEDCFLVADQRGLWVMDGSGAVDLLYQLPAERKQWTCHEPRPLVARQREPVVAPRVAAEEPTAKGRLVLANVYAGRNMEGVRRGEIKKLLVLEQLPKPINFSGGMWPISAGGTFTLARVLGTVPVAEDGSADFEVPALRSLFFVALDEQELAVKRMQSFVSVQPGETLGCVGCHEPRGQTPGATFSATALRSRTPPARITPYAEMPDVLDFHRDVQPILDRYCVECHQPQRAEGHIDLTGDHTPLFCQSYWTILHHGLIADGRNETYGNRPPRSIGSSASRLLTFLDGSHYDVRISDQERTIVRLWIESGAVYAGTYAALGSGMHPVEFPIEVLERRCGDCHGHAPPKSRIGQGRYFRFGPQGSPLPLVHTFADLQQIRGSIGYYKCGNARPPQSLCNLTRPVMSLMLRAPLARGAGGLQWCGQGVFSDTSDADYQAILARVRAAAELHAQEKRFDMPGFRPNVYYVRMLQDYGVLPRDLPPDQPLDVYAADRAYWDSFP